MPRVLRIPTEDVLPPGAHRVFLTELHRYFREAGRPEISRIVATIERLAKDPHSIVMLTLSRETVRRILKGETLSSWKRVEALFEALCFISNRDPEQDRWAEENYPFQTHRSYFKEVWSAATDGVELQGLPLPQQKIKAPQSSVGGWGTNSGGGYSDEPPF